MTSSDGGAAAEVLRARLGDRRPLIAITMGSGLGGLADRIEDPTEIPYAELPGWPSPTVVGHAGKVVSGSLGGVPVLGLSGRVHLYEGEEPDRTTFYVRVLGELGIRILFLSNAAGAIHPGFGPGELMLISDHVNMMFQSPLSGPVREGEDRFPDMSDPYDSELRGVVRDTALALGIPLQEGVYAAMHGPSYETPAEIRMLARLGMDAVGMSTVPEVIAARARGIRCVAVSCLSNYAAGVTSEPLDHDEVIQVTRQVQDDFERLVAESVARFPV
jgi:purine-nucleoside phosphorylase